MATAITPTKTAGLTAVPGLGFEAEYTCLFDSTDAQGKTTIDLTDDFSELHSVKIGGSLAGTGYVCEVEKPAIGTALTATNLKLLVLEAGADAAPLDPLASTDVSAVITGLTISVVGKKAIVASWQ